jgi:acyl carrier protein
MTNATQTHDQLRDEIRVYISESFFGDQREQTLGFDDDLLGALNSLQLLRLVIELESRYSFVIQNTDLTPENFGTLEKVAAYVALKRG